MNVVPSSLLDMTDISEERTASRYGSPLRLPLPQHRIFLQIRRNVCSNEIVVYEEARLHNQTKVEHKNKCREPQNKSLLTRNIASNLYWPLKVTAHVHLRPIEPYKAVRDCSAWPHNHTFPRYYTTNNIYNSTVLSSPSTKLIISHFFPRFCDTTKIFQCNTWFTSRSKNLL